MVNLRRMIPAPCCPARSAAAPLHRALCVRCGCRRAAALLAGGRCCCIRRRERGGRVRGEAGGKGRCVAKRIAHTVLRNPLRPTATLCRVAAAGALCRRYARVGRRGDVALHWSCFYVGMAGGRHTRRPGDDTARDAEEEKSLLRKPFFLRMRLFLFRNRGHVRRVRLSFAARHVARKTAVRGVVPGGLPHRAACVAWPRWWTRAAKTATFFGRPAWRGVVSRLDALFCRRSCHCASPARHARVPRL